MKAPAKHGAVARHMYARQHHMGAVVAGQSAAQAMAPVGLQRGRAACGSTWKMWHVNTSRNSVAMRRHCGIAQAQKEGAAWVVGWRANKR